LEKRSCKNKKQRVEAILEEGLDLQISNCTTSEGINYTGRRVGDGKILGDIYKHLDVDFEPTCGNLSASFA
jgi:hypothetical protein